MDDAFSSLLEATIARVEALRARGVRYVPVRPETVRRLGRPPDRRSGTRPQPTPSPSARPAPAAVASPPSRLPLSDPKPAALDEKAAALRALEARVRSCVRCPHLAASRTQTVFGIGNPAADLMFVGEAPGEDEDRQGEPFVGRAGQLLTRIIQTMGLERGQVYIGNVLKCRPDTPEQAYGNRKPTPSEMVTCLPYLEEQIAIIQPRILVALGLTAVEGLLGKQAAGRLMNQLRGQWLEFRGIPLMVTYHPAYLLRNQSLSEKRKVWEDMLLVMERLELPISAKQRQFFLRATGA